MRVLLVKPISTLGTPLTSLPTNPLTQTALTSMCFCSGPGSSNKLSDHKRHRDCRSGR